MEKQKYTKCLAMYKCVHNRVIGMYTKTFIMSKKLPFERILYSSKAMTSSSVRKPTNTHTQNMNTPFYAITDFKKKMKCVHLSRQRQILDFV